MQTPKKRNEQTHSLKRARAAIVQRARNNYKPLDGGNGLRPSGDYANSINGNGFTGVSQYEMIRHVYSRLTLEQEAELFGGSGLRPPIEEVYNAMREAEEEREREYYRLPEPAQYYDPDYGDYDPSLDHEGEW